MERPPLPKPPCPTCPLGQCSCPSAASIARRSGVHLPDDRTKRVKGGHLGDYARGGYKTQVRRMQLEAGASLTIRIYFEWVEARLAAIELADIEHRPELAEEHARLTLHRTFIDLKFYRDPPATVKELGALYGHQHDWAVHRWREIVCAASARPRSVETVAERCGTCDRPRIGDPAHREVACACVKQCRAPTCGAWLPPRTPYFHRDPSRHDGLSRRCAECEREATKGRAARSVSKPRLAARRASWRMSSRRRYRKLSRGR